MLVPVAVAAVGKVTGAGVMGTKVVDVHAGGGVAGREAVPDAAMGVGAGETGL